MSNVEINKIDDPYKLREMAFNFFMEYGKVKANPSLLISDMRSSAPGQTFRNLESMEQNLYYAIDCMERVVEILPDFYFDWMQLGVFYSEAMSFDRAIQCFEKSLELKPDFDHAHQHLGTTYEKKNDRQKAYDYKIKAVALNPENSYAWEALGLNYNLTNQYDKAIACLKRAIEISPMNQLARRNLQYALEKRNKR